MDTVLVTGGAIGDIPAISELKKSGYRVLTSGNRPHDFGHRLSHKYIPGDYTSVDDLLSIVKRNKVIGIVSSCHDLAYITAAEIAFKTGLPGYDLPAIAKTIHNKALLRKSLAECNIKTPRFFSFNSRIEIEKQKLKMSFPVIVKPVDLTGGNGITIAKNQSDLIKSFDFAYSLSTSKEVIVEEYLQGSYHGCTAIIENKKITFIFFDNEHFLYDKFRVSATSFPSALSEFDKRKISRDIESFSRKMSLVDGLIHLQIINTLTGPVILEICRRMPGDLYPYFVEQASAFDYTKHVVSKFLGKSLKSIYHKKIDAQRY
jgi:biotin carboxylase